MKEQLLAEVARWGWPLLMAALMALGAWLAPALKAKLKHEGMLALFARVERLAGQVVLELDQVVVQALKDATADGKLSAEDIKNVSTLAMERLQRLLGDKGLHELRGAGGDVDRTLRTMLEAKVRELRPTQSLSGLTSRGKA